MAAKKSSLVGNINRRKKKGTSRPKSRSTISRESYDAMQEGWPESGKKTKKKASKKKASKKRASKKKASRKS